MNSRSELIVQVCFGIFLGFPFQKPLSWVLL